MDMSYMSSAPASKGNGGAIAKFIVSAVLFVLGFVGIFVVNFVGIGDPFSPGFITMPLLMDDTVTSMIITLIALLVVIVLFLVSAILLCSGFKSLSRNRKGIANAYGGGKVSLCIILGNIFIALGFYTFMLISSLTAEIVAYMFGMNPLDHPFGIIQTVCLILFIAGLVLFILGTVLALVSYKRAAGAFNDDSYIPLSSYVTKPMSDVGYDAAAGGYDPNAAYAPNGGYDPNAAYAPNGGYDPNAAYAPNGYAQPEDNYDSIPVGGQPDAVFTDPQPQPQPQPMDFQNFEPANVPNYAQNDTYNIPNNPISDFEPKSISQFENAPVNNAPAQDAYNAGYNAAPAQDAYNAGYNAAPAQDAYNAGYNAAPAQDAYNAGYNAAPAQDAYNAGYNAAPAQDAYNAGDNAAHYAGSYNPAPADGGSRLKSTFKAPRNPDGASSGSIPAGAMNQEYTKPHDRFKSAGDL